MTMLNSYSVERHSSLLCTCGSSSAVEHRLAKARVASSNLVFRSRSCDDSCEVPPVPIPNTVVKLTYAESTWLETAWEDR